jgi:hypothetical protein
MNGMKSRGPKFGFGEHETSKKGKSKDAKYTKQGASIRQMVMKPIHINMVKR